jgi:hypothetical protein
MVIMVTVVNYGHFERQDAINDNPKVSLPNRLERRRRRERQGNPISVVVVVSQASRQDLVPSTTSG